MAISYGRDISEGDNATLKAQLLRFQAELKRRSSSETSVEYLKTVVASVSKIRGPRFSELRFDCLQECVRRLYPTGQFEVSLAACNEMGALSKASGRLVWQRKAQNFAGVVHAESGNLGEALVCYHASLETARRINDLSGEVSVLGNLAVAFQYASLYREAIPCLRNAIETATRSGKGVEHIPSAYCNLAQNYLAIGDLEDARRCITLSLGQSENTVDRSSAHNRTIREWTFINVALECGDIVAARNHLTLIEKFASISGGEVGVFLCKLSRGLFLVHADSVDEGLELLHAALAESAAQFGQFHRLDARVALVKAYEACGQPHAALRYMRELMAEMSRTRREQLESLLRLAPTANIKTADYVDLHAWKFREARLRAAAAEQDVVSARFDMLERLAIAASLKEDPSGEHGYRVGKLTSLLGQQLGWTRERCHAIEIAARLHDVGKVGIPDGILLGSHELQEAEREFMRSHTLLGAELLAKSDVPQLRIAEEIARHHHERWDGAGYPAKLSGERIPISARMVALADVFDALTHGRPYAPAWPAERAMAEIRELAGSHFDPDLTQLFLDLVATLRQKHPDLDSFLGSAAQESAFLQARRNLKNMLQDARQTFSQSPLYS